VSGLAHLALNLLNAVLIGLMDVVFIAAFFGLPIWLIAHFALGGARKALEREEAEKR
jgi:type IV secretory pathway TrbD component